MSQWDATRGRFFDWSEQQGCFLYPATTSEQELRVFPSMTDDGPSKVRQCSDPSEKRIPDKHWAKINYSNEQDNCPWTTLAALLCDETRVPTTTVYKHVLQAGVLSDHEINRETKLDGPATKEVTLKAAGVFGVIQKREIQQPYYEGILAAYGIPERVSFAVSSDEYANANRGHQLVGYYDKGWVKFTDWQYDDVGEDSTEWMKTRYIKFVYWFESLRKWR